MAEIPSLELPRRTGRSALRSIPDGRRVLRTLLAERRRANAAQSDLAPGVAVLSPARDHRGT